MAKSKLINILIPALVLAPALALAHGGATGVVKERMDIFKSWKQGVKQLGPMAKGKLPLDSDWVAQFAAKLQSESSQLKTLFPEGSDQRPSEALPSVWSEREKFDGLFDDLIEHAEALAGSAKSEDVDGVVDATAALGKTCKSCHNDFRD